MKRPSKKKTTPAWGDHVLHGRQRRTRPLYMKLDGTQDTTQRPYRALVGGRSHIHSTQEQSK